jgi:hypothetical protein
MDNYFNNNLDPDTMFDSSDSGYSNNVIGLSFLRHFIEHTQSSSSSRYKMLLFDGADSHVTNEFQQLALEHNIILYQYPSHLTHLMQPLDVGCFQTYKLWHEQAVHSALRNLEFNYNTSSFLRDLPDFRKKTFTPKLIMSAFQKSGMWPPDPKVVLRRMKKYSDPQESLPPLITDNNVFCTTPKTISHTLKAGQAWNERLAPELSSPSRENYARYTRAVETQLRVAELEQNDLAQIRLSVKEQQKSKATCRMYTVGKVPIKAKDAKVAIAEKNARKRPKKQLETKFVVPVDSDNDEVMDGDMGDVDMGDGDDLIHPELRGIVLGDPISNPFEDQHDYIKF